MALLGFQCKPVCLDVKEVCFDEENDIPIFKCEKSTKSESVAGWCRCGVMDTNAKCWSCCDV